MIYILVVFHINNNKITIQKDKMYFCFPFNFVDFRVFLLILLIFSSITQLTSHTVSFYAMCPVDSGHSV